MGAGPAGKLGSDAIVGTPEGLVNTIISQPIRA